MALRANLATGNSNISHQAAGWWAPRGVEVDTSVQRYGMINAPPGAALANLPPVHAMTTPVTFTEMLRRLLRAEGQGRAAKTVEIYGWALLIEGATSMISPHLVATILGIPPLVDQGVDYFRLAAVWVAGIGLLYVLSGRLNANGFVFSTLLDRPLVLPILGILWYFGMVPGILALGAGLQDLVTCLWTWTIWRKEFGGGGTGTTS